MIYKSVVGSRLYGLSVATSDMDIAFVPSGRAGRKYFGEHRHDMYPWGVDEFANLRKKADLQWVCYPLLFPHEFCIENELSKWIVENRECLIKSLLPDVYETYMSTSSNFAKHSRGMNKRVMYAIHFRNMLANYAEGMTFADALRPTGVERTFLLSVRNGIAPKELVIEANAKARERAIAVAGFYAEPKADLVILDEFKHMVYREVELLK